MAKKYVYLFSEGNGSMRELLGGKGANLAEMTNLGMPVPQGFTVTTEACTRYYQDGRQIAPEIQDQIYEYLGRMEQICGKKFADPENPLLVSVRSGARASMPGMMDTILNLGLNDTVVEGLAKFTGNPRFAYDSYRRFIQMFSDVVMELSKKRFEEIIDEVKAQKGVENDIDLDTGDMKELVRRFKDFYQKEKGEPFPQEPRAQLMEAVQAVFRSWDNPRANVYRRMNEIPYEWGTAVNVQAMVFGNAGGRSGTGVAFTRNPATGEKALFGEYLINAQGEDVVAGVRTPSPISHLREEMPEVYDQFAAIAGRLEQHYRDMQDMEFTIENGTLYMLQTRNGKRTAAAALKIAVDLVDEGMIDEREAVLRVDPKQLDALLHPQFDSDALKKAKPIGSGLAASPGAACGRVVFTAEDAKAWHERGEKVVLVRLETSPEDIEGMQVSQGILTVRGGMTSHAAVVARGMGTCCVSGCGEIAVDYENRKFTLAGKDYREGDWISLDGSTGNIYAGPIPTVPADPSSGDFGRFMGWADQYRQMEVYTNADTPRDARQGRAFGAQGIGLCRTEHMFFDGERIKAMREMIVSETTEARRRRPWPSCSPISRGTSRASMRPWRAARWSSASWIPPLHEFLPTKEEDIRELAADMGVTEERLHAVIDSLHEFNPMMGHRGCRLAVSFPEIAEMQTTRRHQRAALAVQGRHPDWTHGPRDHDPPGGRGEGAEVSSRTWSPPPPTGCCGRPASPMEYEVGTMIEVPRAALTADEIARGGRLLLLRHQRPDPDDLRLQPGRRREVPHLLLRPRRSTRPTPSPHLDQKGVGRLVEMAVQLGRGANPALHLGICGEHGGDPTSGGVLPPGRVWTTCPCSPYRVPIARLAAAQAAIRKRGELSSLCSRKNTHGPAPIRRGAAQLSVKLNPSFAGLLDEVHKQGAAVGVLQPHRDGGPLQLMPVGGAAVHPLGAELRRRQGAVRVSGSRPSSKVRA